MKIPEQLWVAVRIYLYSKTSLFTKRPQAAPTLPAHCDIVQQLDPAGFFTIGPYSGGDFSTGLDTPELISRLPQNYSGGIWTNEIETIANELRNR